MNRTVFLLVNGTLALTGLLTSCSQHAPPLSSVGQGVAAYLTRPELQDPDSQAILVRYSGNPELLAALQTAYGERPAQNRLRLSPALQGLGLTEDRLAYIKTVAWNSVADYDSQYARFLGTALPFPDLDWNRNGCSTPTGLGLGYTEDFRPACNVHDFGYRNLPLWERTDANRKATDQNFHRNMDSICAAKSWYKRPACYSASFAYYEAVRVGGDDVF
ncbi:phospholipase A2 [Deinococcus oregonensis]|uniref:Phospholipase A2 n=1 Tax=Deinococcus oregonensis TaxID=1805970 RepID=A0ABV6B6T3_9DEIO